jgi:Zn-dependent M28 family amino/carboxypeptidase
MEARVDSLRLRQILTAIAGERNPFGGQSHLAAVEAFIEEELASCGLKIESDYFSFRGEKFRNVIGKLGSQSIGPTIIVGAHFDSVQGTPGADDNASGVAVLLEAARVLSKKKLSSQVLFAAFQLEEFNMVGSTHFARKLKQAGAKVDAMLSLEMVGYTDSRPGTQRYPAGLGRLYPDRGDFIALIGNWRSNKLLRRVAQSLRQIDGLPVETLSLPGNGAFVPAARLSDHAPFWDLGFSALLITDTAFLRNPHYHRASDTLDSLDISFMAKVCEGVIRDVLAL